MAKTDKPNPEQAVRLAAEILRVWEEGADWTERVPACPEQDILRNGLFTLFRRRGQLDWLLERLAPRPPRPRLRRILWWTLTEMLWGRVLPPEVAADAAVSHVRRRCGAAEAGFVNAVFRRALAAGGTPLVESLRSSPAPLHVRSGLGPELTAAWSARMPEAELLRLGEVLQEPAPLTVRIRKVCGLWPVVCGENRIEEAGVANSASPVIPSSSSAHRPTDHRPQALFPLTGLDWVSDGAMFECADPAAFFASPEFRAGHFYVQDPSTLLAPWLLAVRPGESVADLCAAPGGKSLLLAEALAGTGRLVCADRSPARLQRLRENVLGAWPGTVVLAMDAAAPALRPGGFDAVLLDVPCSNSGVVRRRPDVRWRFTREKVRDLVCLQRAILEGAAPLLRPGGRLAYSTCSIEPEEDGDQVRRFLERHPEFRLESERLLLPETRHDGAYAAVLRRAGVSCP